MPGRGLIAIQAPGLDKAYPEKGAARKFAPATISALNNLQVKTIADITKYIRNFKLNILRKNAAEADQILPARPVRTGTGTIHRAAI
jgi:hypothetical protein